jgi:hypothetical protein
MGVKYNAVNGLKWGYILWLVFIVYKVTLFLNNLVMGLLGKTLKGRSARPGGLPPKKNIKIRQIAKTQE